MWRAGDGGRLFAVRAAVGLAVGDVRPEVHLWHGLGDPLVPVEHALQLAIALPRCRAFLHPDEGHHFFRRRLGEILSALVGDNPGPAVTPVIAHTLALRASAGVSCRVDDTPARPA